MKNIHVLTTLSPSRMLRGFDGIRLFKNEVSPDNQWCVNVNIHITNDEEIKDGDKRINNYQRKPKGEEIPSKKIILTTDQDLIKDGVQAIDDEFLEWFVKNPSCEEVEVIYEPKNFLDTKQGWEYEIIIPKEEPKQETIEEDSFIAGEESFKEFRKFILEPNRFDFVCGFTAGAKWQQEQDKNKYSEEEVIDILVEFSAEMKNISNITKWFEQFKKK